MGRKNEGLYAMNQYGIMDIIGVGLLLSSLFSLYFLEQRHQSFIRFVLPYVILVFASGAAYLDGRDDWYAILFLIPVYGLMHAIMKMQR